MSISKSLVGNLFVVFSTVAFAIATNAGEILKLNAGRISTAQVQKQYSNVYANSKVTEWILQFKKPITEENKKALHRAGFEVFSYLPDDALVVRTSHEALDDFQKNNKSVHGFVPYIGSYKVSRDFGATSVFNRDAQVALLVQVFKADEASSIAQKIAQLDSNVRVQNADGRTMAIVMPRNLIPLVAALTGVEHIQAQPEIELYHFALEGDMASVITQGAGDYTDLNGSESGTTIMHIPSVWREGFTGKGQIASMADTGLDSGDGAAIHPDFQNAVRNGYFFGLFSKSWLDPMGHGTHVAGSIVGRSVPSGGKLRGGAYEALFVPESMWSPMLNNLSVPNKLQDLFSKAYSDGARVHSNSWGSPKSFGAYDNFANQVDDYMFNNPDMLVLFAAGNSGTDKNRDGRIDPNSIGSPGTAKNVLTVGASENKTTTGGIQVPVSKLRAAKDEWSTEPIYSSMISDNENGLAMFSSRGPTLDGRVKPEIVAPGTNILSARSQQAGASELWGAYNQHYVWAGGTSMATPLTAGAVVLTRQILQERHHIANPSAALMKATLMHTAFDMYPGQYGEGGANAGQELLTRRPNSDEGYGRVDMDGVLALNAKSTLFVDENAGVAQGAQKSYDVVCPTNCNLLANLVWTDAPASANAAQSLVNDLDMSIVTPDGRTLSAIDHVNNHEVIEQQNLPAGTYRVTVKGYRVPSGKAGAQPFALVVSFK